jgi:hypothetical protein
MITWITPAGRISIVTERIILDIPLEATSTVGPITFTLLAGSLPRGLRLDTVVATDSTQGTVFIKGSPTEVEKYTVSRFVVRADDGEDIEDRTFSIDVDGSDEPAWLTKEGFLNVGSGENYFVLDGITPWNCRIPLSVIPYRYRAIKVIQWSAKEPLKTRLI